MSQPPATTPIAHRPDPGAITRLHFSDANRATIRPLGAASPDFFTAFGLPARLTLDGEALRDAFLDLSRRFHPDYFAQAAPAIREESLRRTSLLNNAYKTLREPKTRAEYLLTLHGKGISSNKAAIPPDLLEEMIDIQEAGEELREARLQTDASRLAAAEARVKPLREQVMRSRQQLEAELGRHFTRFDAAADRAGDPSTADCQAILREIRTTLDRMNYVRTMLRNLK